LRRASRRFFSSSSFEAKIDLTAGMKADYRVSMRNSLSPDTAHTFLRFPVLSFSAFSDGASSSPGPPGPMLLLRVLRAVFFGDDADFFGDCEGALNDPFAIKPSAMLSLLAMAVVVSLCGFVVVVFGTRAHVNTVGAHPNNAGRQGQARIA
jgi:hypothetical protein